MKLILALLMFTNAHADDDFMKLGQAEVQSFVEQAFHDGSVDGLNYTRDGVQHFASGGDEWTMLFAAKAALDKKWRFMQPTEYQVTIGAAVPWNGDPNLLHYPVSIRADGHGFKAPVCLDYRFELQGVFIIYRSDDGAYKQRGLDLKSFTPSILDQAQCV